MREARATAEFAGGDPTEVAEAEVTQMTANALLRDLTAGQCSRGFWRVRLANKRSHSGTIEVRAYVAEWAAPVSLRARDNRFETAASGRRKRHRD